MSAVIGPVGVNDLDFRNGRIPVFFSEIVLAELQIGQIHCKPVFCEECGKLLFVHLVEAVQDCHLCRNLVVHLEGVKFL